MEIKRFIVNDPIQINLKNTQNEIVFLYLSRYVCNDKDKKYQSDLYREQQR